ncbi:metacaspase-2-like [Condylostylus longicornis]|uniref:metacaspase-2-like n=1 Tax=Condylostylus longicornis TaxID=2530218 RepID=UPI00244DF4BA|nr:metacaspase-2-like [Condylostylus longicornis]
MATNEIASLAETKVCIKALILSNADAYNLDTLRKDFKKSIGYDIPFRAFGYSSLEDFLKSMPDILSLKRQQGILYIQATGDNKKSEHITYMVSKQKKKPNQTNKKNFNQTSCNALNLSQSHIPISNFPMFLNNYNQLYNNQAILTNYFNKDLWNIPTSVLQNYNQARYNNMSILPYLNINIPFPNVINQNQNHVIKTENGNERGHRTNQNNRNNTNGPLDFQKIGSKVNAPEVNNVSEIVNKYKNNNINKNHNELNSKMRAMNVEDKSGNIVNKSTNNSNDSPQTTTFFSDNPKKSEIQKRLDYCRMQNEDIKVRNCTEKNKVEEMDNNHLNCYQDELYKTIKIPCVNQNKIENRQPNHQNNDQKNLAPNSDNLTQLEKFQIPLKHQEICKICSESQNKNSESAGGFKNTHLSGINDDIESIWDSREDESFIIKIRLNNKDFALNVEKCILPDSLTKKNLHEIIVTYIHNPHRFWFRFKSYDSIIYNNFKTELNKFCNEDFYKRWGLQKEHLQPGNVFCIPYKNIWHRAKLIAKNENIIKLYLIDVGIIIKSCTNYLRYLPKKYSILPSQAFRGSLEGIAPFTERWSQESVNTFFRMSSTDIIKCNIKFIKDNIAYILAFDTTKNPDEQFFNEIFLKKKLAKRCENDHFENKFPTFEMIENSEYPALSDIRDMINNLGIPYFSNEYKLLKEFEHLNTDDLRELYLHFKNTLTSQVINNINKKCSVILKMRYKKINATETNMENSYIVEEIAQNGDTSHTNNQLTKHELDVNERVLRWVEQYNKRHLSKE